MGILEGKTGVITGASRGFGLAMARAFLQEGCRVVISARSADSINLALKALDMTGRTAGLPCEVSDLEQVQALASYAVQAFGRLDIWVNNAGTAGPYGPTMGVAPETFQRVLQTNITGVYNGSYTALEHFLPQKQGKLMNILGRGYRGPVPYQNAYASSKYWMRSFTRCLAEENKTSGVDILAFNPGMMVTDLLTDVEVISGYEDRLKYFSTVIRMWAKPPELAARKAAWLASSATDGQNGRLFSVMSAKDMLAGAVREGWGRITGKKGPEENVKIRSVPYGKG
jgi:NAD(P)-dependent dehydrogenase (short-subunit alcohol dehydrogenase family)